MNFLCDSFKFDFEIFWKMLDLIGWSANELGEHLWQQNSPGLGYLELSYLADAIQEYTKRPNDVYKWVTELMREEME